MSWRVNSNSTFRSNVIQFFLALAMNPLFGCAPSVAPSTADPLPDAGLGRLPGEAPCADLKKALSPQDVFLKIEVPSGACSYYRVGSGIFNKMDLACTVTSTFTDALQPKEACTTTAAIDLAQIVQVTADNLHPFSLKVVSPQQAGEGLPIEVTRNATIALYKSANNDGGTAACRPVLTEDRIGFSNQAYVALHQGDRTVVSQTPSAAFGSAGVKATLVNSHTVSGVCTPADHTRDAAIPVDGGRALDTGGNSAAMDVGGVEPPDAGNTDLPDAGLGNPDARMRRD